MIIEVHIYEFELDTTHRGSKGRSNKNIRDIIPFEHKDAKSINRSTKKNEDYNTKFLKGMQKMI